MEVTHSTETSVLTNPHSSTSQKAVFFIVTSVKTSNPTKFIIFVQHYFHEVKFAVWGGMLGHMSAIFRME
jgi:hypothetical protein